MKQFFFLLSFLTLSLFGHSQMTAYTPQTKRTDADERAGFYGGLSLGYFHYKTTWYYHSSSSPHDHNPVHSINRVVIALDLERKGVWKTTAVQFDLGGELLFGPTGKAKGIWLGDDQVISSGGWSAGVNAYVRAVYTPSQTGSVRVFPFLSLGPHYMFLHNNGKVKGAIASEPAYGYTDGWNEGVTLIAGSVGADLAFDHFVLTPEFRFGLFGWNSSSWEPHGAGVTMNGGPGFTAFSVRIAKRF
jgi:hypothetical protein